MISTEIIVKGTRGRARITALLPMYINVEYLLNGATEPETREYGLHAPGDGTIPPMVIAEELLDLISPQEFDIGDQGHVCMLIEELANP